MTIYCQNCGTEVRDENPSRTHKNVNWCIEVLRARINFLEREQAIVHHELRQPPNRLMMMNNDDPFSNLDEPVAIDDITEWRTSDNE